MGCRCNGELTEVCERNDRADEAATSRSQLVTQVGQLVARAQISYCGIWIVGRNEVARFGYLQADVTNKGDRVNIFSETFLHWERGRPGPRRPRSQLGVMACWTSGFLCRRGRAHASCRAAAETSSTAPASAPFADVRRFAGVFLSLAAPILFLTTAVAVAFRQEFDEPEFLFGVELKIVQHALEPGLPRLPAATSGPSLVAVQGERASRKAKQKNHNHSHANLPFAFVDDVHTFLRRAGPLTGPRSYSP